MMKISPEMPDTLFDALPNRFSLAIRHLQLAIHYDLHHYKSQVIR